ncbi:hypothetical protein [Flavobacterium algicola]|uniref:hypothetical protein n=1 Tax=Flavobacterium algicola TaxID=556529 RepID=UPI001EFC3695|nr:hypothetical protein [Flavobacterium algicola]MCG9793381.1 hypothetical protein [Flavobacterium algicola]
MKNNFKKLLLLPVLSLFVLSCSYDDDNLVDDSQESSQEYKYLRVLVSDENSTELSLVNPLEATVQSFDAKFPKSALYTTESGRYAGIIHRADNTVETFDSGFEYHGDHVDTKGTPKFGGLVGLSLLPTHFKSKLGEILTFNDGDGTLSIANESEIHTVGATFKTINAGLLAHHGAMATFQNGTYAITEKDNSIAGTLPEKVKIIDNTGKTVYDAKIGTKGIHGNASDGTYALFGSASGILVVESNGNQKLIDHPTDFGTTWFGTILETAYDGKFIGYAAAKGAYMIDVVTNTVTPIFESTNIMQCKVSYNHKKLGILLHSGEIKIYDLNSLQQDKSASVIAATSADSTQKPQLELSERFAYITSPTTAELLQINLSNLNVTKVKVSSTPYRITIFGHENSVAH